MALLYSLLPRFLLQIQANETVAEFQMAVQNVTAQSLTAICGGGDFQSLQALTENLVERLKSLVAAAAGVLSILKCETLVPIYVSFILHEAACDGWRPCNIMLTPSVVCKQ